MPEYVYELVEYLKESYAIRKNIAFELQIENISLNHPLAISIGLILNEAITNSIKYAFPQNQDGKIFISLSHTSPTHIQLTIADNGCGLPAGWDKKVNASMGMELLQGLTEDMGGQISIQNNNGTQINISFKYDG
jgi:two-component system, sensor histidine kinase PdtaS